MPATPSALSTLSRRLAPSLPRTTRPFTTSLARHADTGNPHASTKGTQQGPMSGDKVGGSRVHALDKGGDKDTNVQSSASASGREYVVPSSTSSRGKDTPSEQAGEKEEQGKGKEEWRSFPYLNLRSGDEVWRRRFDGEPNELDEELTYASPYRSRATDTGGSAPREKDERNSTKKAKEQYPEAPDVVIGMQDERGGKGV
ncbi:hypothetical protein B0A50_05280 [Salinomyces thailandicus]|uniref:Uncharacterized protein n=1 Tax=Salinomyces thailandicus TaxID=706561 RepID=A0A4U0TVY6_9PEZI|nr:hypothetical protein B0A50_05280 [Salinomyces thailandica]